MTTKLAEFGADAVRPTATSTAFISFAIGDDQYGIHIMAVREINGWSDVTCLPKQPQSRA
jgi:purine-binding chemotaxis protein CheW